MSDELVPAVAVQPPVKRRRTLGIVIAVVAVLVVGGAAATVTTLLLHLADRSKPTHFASPAFGYAVTLPGAPSVTKRTASSGEPSQRIQWDGGGGLTVTVEAEELTVLIPSARIPAVLEAGLKGGSGALKGTGIRDRKTFTLDGVRAQSEVMNTSVAGVVYETVAVKGKVVYSIIITHPTAALERSVERSFTFTN